MWWEACIHCRTESKKYWTPSSLVEECNSAKLDECNSALCRSIHPLWLKKNRPWWRVPADSKNRGPSYLLDGGLVCAPSWTAEAGAAASLLTSGPGPSAGRLLSVAADPALPMDCFLSMPPDCLRSMFPDCFLSMPPDCFLSMPPDCFRSIPPDCFLSMMELFDLAGTVNSWLTAVNVLWHSVISVAPFG